MSSSLAPTQEIDIDTRPSTNDHGDDNHNDTGIDNPPYSQEIEMTLSKERNASCTPTSVLRHNSSADVLKTVPARSDQNAMNSSVPDVKTLVSGQIQKISSQSSSVALGTSPSKKGSQTSSMENPSATSTQNARIIGLESHIGEGVGSTSNNNGPVVRSKASSHQLFATMDTKYSTWTDHHAVGRSLSSSPSATVLPNSHARHARSSSAAEPVTRPLTMSQTHAYSSSSLSANVTPTVNGTGPIVTQPIVMSPLREETARSSGTPISSRPHSFSRRNNSILKGLSSASLGPQSATATNNGRRSMATRNQNKQEREVLVGTPVKEGHVNYMLMYDMLTGIRISVSRCNAKLPRDLELEDFTASHKLAFDVTGNELTPSSRYDFKFKDYAPWVFRSIRGLFHVDPAEYLLSLTGKYVLSELGSPGKSGSFFYFSQDYRFIIKTIHRAEHKFILKILRNYYEHIKANPHTLISRIFGLHRVKLPGKRKIHFVVMGNVFPPHKDIHEIYDLKGSTVGRCIPDEEARKNPRAVMKDLNWVERGRQLHLGPERRKLLIEQMERDVDFLMRLEIMDYSFLIGLHDSVKGNRDNIRDQTLSIVEPNQETMNRRTTGRMSRAMNMPRKPATIDEVSLNAASSRFSENAPPERRYCIFYQDEGGFQATDETNFPLKEIYYIGIIDIFTKYSLTKKIENFFKGMSSDRQHISAIPPDQYGLRFLDFMKNAISGFVKTGVATSSVNNIEVPAPSAPIAVPGTTSSTPGSTSGHHGTDHEGTPPPGTSSYFGSYASTSGAQDASGTQTGQSAGATSAIIYGSAPAALMIDGLPSTNSNYSLKRDASSGVNGTDTSRQMASDASRQRSGSSLPSSQLTQPLQNFHHLPPHSPSPLSAGEMRHSQSDRNSLTESTRVHDSTPKSETHSVQVSENEIHPPHAPADNNGQNNPYTQTMMPSHSTSGYRLPTVEEIPDSASDPPPPMPRT